MACVFVYVIVLALVGPERLGRRFDVAHDEDMAEATGSDTVATAGHQGTGQAAFDHDSSDDGKGNSYQKETAV